VGSPTELAGDELVVVKVVLRQIKAVIGMIVRAIALATGCGTAAAFAAPRRRIAIGTIA
jgi:Na+/glutamate symporter